jgi:hypothetical protein
MLSPEQMLLGSRRLHEPAREDGHALASSLDRVPDKASLVRLALSERMGCILYRDLLVLDLLDALGTELGDVLHEEYLRTAALNLRLLHDVEELLGKLSIRGIPVVLLKGVALLVEIYPDIGLRPMSDADIWVRRGDWPAVAETLDVCGYEADPAYRRTFRRGVTTLDLHTNLMGAGRIRRRTRLLAAGAGPLFECTRPIKVGSQTALGLSRSDEVFYLGLHGLKHNLERLIWLVEINHLVERLSDDEWDEVSDRAEQMRQELSVLCTAYLADLLLAGRCHPRLVDMARSERLGPYYRRVLRNRASNGSLPSHAPLLLFTPRHGPGSRALYTLETLFPRPSVLRRSIRDGDRIGVGRLYWRRFCQLLERTIR